MCREMCYPGRKLRLLRDHRASTPMYCQCDKATCRCLVPGGVHNTTNANANANHNRHGSSMSYTSSANNGSSSRSRSPSPTTDSNSSGIGIGNGIGNGNGIWTPQPVDVESMRDSDAFRDADGDMQRLAELLARNNHRFWCQQKRLNGWRYGDRERRLFKQTPSLRPWEGLPADKRAAKKASCRCHGTCAFFLMLAFVHLAFGICAFDFLCICAFVHFVLAFVHFVLAFVHLTFDFHAYVHLCI